MERYCPPQREDSVDRAIAEKAITIILTEIHLRLDEATRIARAAEACALAGSIAEGAPDHLTHGGTTT